MIWSDLTFWIIMAALAFDAMIGDPDFIWRRIPHPVAAFGALIGWLDQTLNRASLPFAQRKLLGIVAVAVLLSVSVAAGYVITQLLRLLPASGLLIALAASIFIAQRSLYEHVARVCNALRTEGLAGGRRAVSMIVGRDHASLDESGVARAAIESAAESFSDGVVAPVFWFALFGLPGLLAYKAINTADSMVGYLDKRHAAFGWAAARLDDVMNFVPARLAGTLIALASGAKAAMALPVMWREALLHRSPNAGWPESAMAAALGLRLGGPRHYDGELSDDPFFNVRGRAVATADDIGVALRILFVACVLHTAIYVALAVTF